MENKIPVAVSVGAAAVSLANAGAVVALNRRLESLEHHLHHLTPGSSGNGGNITQLSQLSDVSLTLPLSDGNILIYSETLSKWANTKQGYVYAYWEGNSTPVGIAAQNQFVRINGTFNVASCRFFNAPDLTPDNTQFTYTGTGGVFEITYTATVSNPSPITGYPLTGQIYIYINCTIPGSNGTKVSGSRASFRLRPDSVDYVDERTVSATTISALSTGDAVGLYCVNVENPNDFTIPDLSIVIKQITL